MSIDPELKAMSEVYDTLSGLNAVTRKRVVLWVLNKLNTTPSAGSAKTGAKRGPKPGKKRGRKPSSAKKIASVSKKTGRRGRPPGSGKKSGTKKIAAKASRRRGRPRKSASKVAAST